MLDEKNCRYIANGQVIELTVKESYMLRILIENKNKVVKYNQLSMELNKSEDIKGCVQTRMKRLREKLKGLLEIKTKYQIGYYI